MPIESELKVMKTSWLNEKVLIRAVRAMFGLGAVQSFQNDTAAHSIDTVSFSR